MSKILILSNHIGGLYNFRYEVIKKLIDNNYKIFFSVPEEKSDKRVKFLLEKGAVKHIKIPINRRGKNPLEDFKLIINYYKTIKKIKPDLILTYSIKPNIYATIVANKLSIPVLLNVTGIGTSLTNSKFKFFIKFLYGFACKKATKVFFQNESNLDLFITNKMVHENNIVLIPGSGVNINKFKPMEKNQKDSKIKFIFIGRIMREKGIEEFIEAAESLTTKYNNLEFQILGFYEEEKYKKIIEEKDSLNYLGYSKDVREEIKEVDCVINPSHHEGMSNVLLESGAMAKPLIASNIPGCKEIIDDGTNGYLFKVRSASSLKNKIIKFINLSNKEKIEMGENSRKKIKNEFDRKVVVETYLSNIEKILE